MSDQSVEVLCGKCRVALEGPTESHDEATYTCPSCGNSDNFKNIMASVKAHSEELMSHSFHKKMGNAFRGSKLIKVDSKPKPKMFHPFITNLKL